MPYELATISSPLMDTDEASRRVHGWTRDPAARGELLGCWRTDIGVLGRLLVLRTFDGPESMSAERERALLSPAPFGARPGTDTVDIESYRRFPFLPTVEPAKRGNVYEIRTYRLKAGGLVPTMQGWEQAMGPARPYTSHLVVNMYALDGAPRITHVWAFDSLEERTALRTAAYREGVWPPLGGPQQIVLAHSTIGLAEDYSPLR